MSVQYIQSFATIGGADSIVFNGPDEQYLGDRLMGARAGIGGTYGVMPDLFLQLEKLIQLGDLEQAQALQFKVNEVIAKLVSGSGHLYAVAKEVLRVNEGIDLGPVRSPLANLGDQDWELAREIASLIQDIRASYVKE